MRKLEFYLPVCKNKGADQLCRNCTADQCLCFRFMDSTISPHVKSKISSFWPFTETVQAGLCRIWSKTSKSGFLALRLKVFVFFQTRLPSDVSDDVDEDPTGNKALWDRGCLNGASQKVK